MNEQFEGEKGLTLEEIANQKYTELQIAWAEEDRAMKKIDNVFTTTPSREEAEKIVLEKYAPQLDEAMKKLNQALDKWMRAMDEAHKKERE